MEQDKIDRINELARKAKTAGGLSPAESLEREKLRREYIEAVKASLRANLDNTYYIDDKGFKRKLRKKGGPSQ